MEKAVGVERVGVVTVAYRSDSVLPVFLDSIPDDGSTAAVVVADNLPGAGDAASIARTRSATYLPLSENRGYGAGMNAAVAALPADATWILLSNPDVVLLEGAISALLAAGRSDPKIGAVGPRVLTEEGDTYPSARSLPSLRTGIGHALFANVWPGNPWTRRYRSEDPSRVVRRDAGWLSGSCLLVRRSVFAELGGFDESYFMYFEDVDLGWRIARAGYRNVYEPAASVVHRGAHSTGTDTGSMLRAHHDSARRFLEHKYSGWALWPLRIALRVALGTRYLIVMRRNGSRSSRERRSG